MREVKGKFVEAGHRYTAAWGEISVRVSQRHNLIALYTTLCATTLGVAYLPMGKPELAPAATRLVYFLPLSTVVFANLLYMHECQIAILRGHLANLEDLDKDGHLPQFYANGSTFGRLAEKARRIHDHSACLMIFAYNALGFLVWGANSYLLAEHFLLVDLWFLVAWVGAVGFALFRIHRIQQKRTQIFNSRKDAAANPLA